MLTISTARPDERDTAFALLFSPLDARERAEQTAALRDAEARGELSLDGLLLARLDTESIHSPLPPGKKAGVRGHPPVAAALLLPQPDQTAFVWPPVVHTERLASSSASAESIADALLREIARRLDRDNLWLGQALLGPDETAGRRSLERNGFPHLADLLYLVRPLHEPLPDHDPAALQTLPYNPAANRDRFAHLLERTYVGTLDCPALNGRRTGDQALFSHRLSGEFDPARWKIYRAEGTDVGLLLMNDHPDQDAWEVVYMGIAPEARGRGYGRAMLLSGLHEARAAGRRAVLLAVDSRNTSALKLYRRLGFLDMLTRTVHARLR